MKAKPHNKIIAPSSSFPQKMNSISFVSVVSRPSLIEVEISYVSGPSVVYEAPTVDEVIKEIWEDYAFEGRFKPWDGEKFPNMPLEFKRISESIRADNDKAMYFYTLNGAEIYIINGDQETYHHYITGDSGYMVPKEIMVSNEAVVSFHDDCGHIYRESDPEKLCARVDTDYQARKNLIGAFEAQDIDAIVDILQDLYEEAEVKKAN